MFALDTIEESVVFAPETRLRSLFHRHVYSMPQLRSLLHVALSWELAVQFVVGRTIDFVIVFVLVNLYVAMDLRIVNATATVVTTAAVAVVAAGAVLENFLHSKTEHKNNKKNQQSISSLRVILTVAP